MGVRQHWALDRQWMLTAKVEFPSLLRWLGEEFDDVRSVGCEPLVVGEGEQYVGRFAPVGDVDRSAVDCGFPLPVFGLNSRLVSCLVVMVLAKARVVLTAQRSQVSKLATPRCQTCPWNRVSASTADAKMR